MRYDLGGKRAGGVSDRAFTSFRAWAGLLLLWCEIVRKIRIQQREGGKMVRTGRIERLEGEVEGKARGKGKEKAPPVKKGAFNPLFMRKPKEASLGPKIGGN